MNPAPETIPRREFFAINGLRFFAATWVLLFHASIHFGHLSTASLIQPILNQGVLAMTLFFMLSGFILSYRYACFASRESVHEYISARIGRLYPVYLFMGLTTIWRIGEGAGRFVIIEEYGYLGAVPFAMFAIFLFVFGLQAWFPNLFGIWNFGGSWSLSVEAFFYSLFPKLRQTIRRLNDRSLRMVTYALPLTIGLISVGLLVSETRATDNSKMFYVLPIFRLPEFLLGMCGYALFVERKLDQHILAWLSAMAIPVLVVGVYWRDLPGLVEWGAPASVVFMGVFVACLSLDATQIVKTVVNYLGRISYCVYMAQCTCLPG
ncbi:MAG: acyltransferase [Planctomycetes bacterium]|nr:acyltransferase [Planctomycetota bacterium]